MQKFTLFFLTSFFLIASINNILGQSRCNNWLYIGGNRTCFRMLGNYNISGTQMTVECLFNRTAAYQPISQGGGDLVSNHCDPTTVNYLLRPNSAQITTSNGFFQATDNATILLNHTYHVAMVYNGSTLTLYRDGVMIKQVPATGTLVTTTNSGSLTTTIGRTACLESATPTDFIGYINEVRLWKVARTQSQIQTAKNTVLANPTLQNGLIGYYTFDNTFDKLNYNNIGYLYSDQGSINGSINSTNPSTTYSICEVPPTPSLPPDPIEISRNSWLRVSGSNSGVSLGNLTITGNKLTIEAVCVRTTAYNTQYEGGDLVSKHCMPSDVSYFLRPNQAGIRTTKGIYIVTSNCKILTNQFYHVALIYDGSTLKLYRNREIIASIPASGNLVFNSWPTHLGSEGCTTPNPAEFIGYINEIRIWNTVRTMSQLESTEMTELNNPSSQQNLIAYYNFKSLINKVNGGTYAGSIIGNAAINQTVSYTQYGANCSCSLCAVIAPQNLRPTRADIVTPNPAHDYITFWSSKDQQYNVINSYGISVKKFEAARGINNFYIKNLPNGTYMLKSSDPAQKILKFLKQ